MAEPSTLTPGSVVKEIVTPDVVYEDCKVLQADALGVLIDVERTLSEGGTIETVRSQILLPWHAVKLVVVSEERP